MNRDLLAIVMGQYTEPYDSDALAFIARLATPPSDAIKTAINTLFVSLKAAGYLSRLDSLYIPKKAAAQADALLDWARPAVSATINGTASWLAADGFCGAASAGAYINTNFIPSVDGTLMTANSAGYGGIITAPVTAGALFGGYGPLPASKNRTMVYFANSPNVSSFSNCAINGDGSSLDTINNTAANSASPGVLQLNRTTDSLQTLYMNGSAIGSSAYTIADRSLSTQKVFILAECDNSGASIGNCGGKMGAWWAGDVFTGAEQLAIKAILDTYFAAVP